MTASARNDNDGDEMLAKAKEQFPENPFADCQPSHTQVQVQVQPTGASSSTAETPAVANVIGDKNPFRLHMAATGSSAGGTSSLRHTATGSTASGTDAFNFASLDQSLPRPPAIDVPSAAPTPAPATSSAQPAQAVEQDHSSSAASTVIPATEAQTTAAPSPPTYAPPAGAPPDAPPLASSAAPASAETYAPPSGPPPEHRRAASATTSSPSRSSAQAHPVQVPVVIPTPRYVPTNVPTPGQPLLRKGKLIVYPRALAECHKCHNTGYKFDDPTHPCRGCWSRYGESVNSLLHKHGSFDRVPGVLQSPLPVRTGPAAGVHRPYDGSHRPAASAGYPGAMANSNTYRYMDNVYGGDAHGLHTPTLPAWLRDPQPSSSSSSSAFRPPPGPPGPPAPPPRPPVQRTEEARQDEARVGGGRQPTEGEPTGDEGVSAEGEVPPSYDEAVSAAADGRTLNSQHVPPPAHRHPHTVRPSSSSAAAPPPPPRPVGYGAPSPYNAGPQSPYGPPVVGPPEAPYGFAPVADVHLVHSGRRPPPHALVVRPGDPRIGGQLCPNCGGEGSVMAPFLDSLFGAPDVQCRVCRGSGRVFR
ncbi:hypothetical protein A4X13_0g3670 [Tilletia indica]|uniref:Uncharacterized protein n=1 Tax=Tilletia indica TaxID=43049 RepID=A0A177TG90_9BASI|nr:hypothetical protein A4X13_0g3670 [Tilletia indica]